MKTSTNQALKDVNKAFAELIRALTYMIFVIPASQSKVLIDSIDTFGESLGIDLKKCARIIGIILLIAVHLFIFSKLIGRAMDIEADSQDMVMVEYKASLNNLAEGE